MPPAATEWTAKDARLLLRAPGPQDDKYTRGVVALATGSEVFPGAAVLGVEGAARAGVGMVRYVGPATPTALVLARRPETVVGAGRADAWVVGSGIPNAAGRSHDDELRVRAAFAGGVPAVVDAGALDVLDAACGPVVITPHFRELERVLAVTAHPLALDEISADPAAAAVRAADALGVAVLLKGATTRIALPGGFAYAVRWGTPWLATAGTGDVLAGIIGALLAAHAGTARHLDDVAMIAATGAVVHGLAGRIAAGDPDGLGAGAPITALDVADAVPDAIEELTARR